MKAIIKIEIPLLAEYLEKPEFRLLRMYVRDFKRTSIGWFITEADIEYERNSGKYVFSDRLEDSVEIYKALFDWGFNEYKSYTGKDLPNGLPETKPGEAEMFYNEHPDGFEYTNARVIGIIE